MVTLLKYIALITFLILQVRAMPIGLPDSIPTSTPIPNGEVIQDARIGKLLDAHIQVNLKYNGIEGYRIQIYFDSGADSKKRALEASSAFQGKFPGTAVYLSFQSPNYKVRVGDFRTRLDAIRFLHGIMSDYPNAFIINDRISLPKVE